MGNSRQIWTTVVLSCDDCDSRTELYVPMAPDHGKGTSPLYTTHRSDVLSVVDQSTEWGYEGWPGRPTFKCPNCK